MKTKKFLCVLLTAMMVLSLAGCSNSSNDSSGSTSGSGSSSQASSQASSDDTKDGEVVIRCSSNLSHTTWDLMQTHQSYEPTAATGDLFLMQADGTIIPMECTAWSLAEDGMSATLTLRDDIYFTSGNHMTSKDLQYTLMRPVNDRTMIGARTYNALENVEIVDDYTVKLVMNSPWPTCLEDIQSTFVIDSEELEKQGYDAYFAMPSTAGPFKVVAFDPVNCSYELARFDGWWGWDVIDNPTNVDRIFYTLSAEDTTRVSALRTGEFDLIELVPYDDTETLKNEGFQVVETTENRHIMLGFNYKSVFKDENLRKAASMAIDRNLIVNSIIGIGWPANFPWSQGIASDPDNPGYEYDMEKAKELVSQYYDGSEISLLTSTAATARVNELAQAVQSMLMEAGFNVKIDMVEEATYDVMRSTGDYDIAIGVFNCTATGEAYKEVCEIIGGDIFGTSCDDQELFDLCAKVQGNCDYESRKEAEHAVYQYEMDHCGPYIYLYCTTGIKACNDRVDPDSMNIDASGNWQVYHLQVKN